MDRSQSLEKAVVGLLLIFALLTFFFPLITFQIPVLGSQDVSGYDIFSKMGVFHDKMQSVPKSSGEPEPEALRSPGNEPSLPISFQCIALIPLEVSLAFVCALIALPGCPGKFRRVHVKVACAVGSLSALAAILHLTVMNSDLHAWFKESMASSAELRGNAFANLAGIVANAFQVKPGIGLYLLAVTLALAAFLCYSRLLETVAIEREPTGLPGPAGCTPERNVSSLNPLSSLDTPVSYFAAVVGLLWQIGPRCAQPADWSNGVVWTLRCRRGSRHTASSEYRQIQPKTNQPWFARNLSQLAVVQSFPLFWF